MNKEEILIGIEHLATEAEDKFQTISELLLAVKEAIENGIEEEALDNILDVF